MDTVIWKKKTKEVYAEKDVINIGDLDAFIQACKTNNIGMNTEVKLKDNEPFTIIVHMITDVT